MPSALPPVLDRMTLSLADVAELAHVQRPVVTTWRRRHADSSHPFPGPVVVRAGSPRFRASDVVAWIEGTSRGNNPAFRADLGLRAGLSDDLGIDPVVAFDGLTALLCLKPHAQHPLAALGRDEILDLADEEDPDDTALYGEVEALGRSLGLLADVADLVADAAYTPAEAVERLVERHRRTARDELSLSVLAPAGRQLVAEVAVALAAARVAPGSDLAFVDLRPGCGDLAVAAVRAAGEGARVRVTVPPDPARPARLARRRLLAQGAVVETLPGGPDAPLPPDAVVLLQVPATGEPEPVDEAVLDAVDDAGLVLAPGQRAVVVGPSAVLCDAPRRPAVERARSHVLRTDRLRAIVRLPAGLVLDRSRQGLGLWVLGDAHPEVAIADRWTTVADLSALAAPAGPHAPFAADVVDDLVSDVLAAQGTRDAVHRHAFRFSRFARSPELLVRGGDLVAGGVAPRRAPRPDADAPAHVVGLADVALGPDHGLAVAVGDGESAPERRLGDLADAGGIEVLPGHRLDPAHVTAAGDVVVLGLPELLGDVEVGSRRIDRLTFAAEYENGRFTEPGDVVFASTPYPVALVDEAGLVVVEFPARVLRLDPDRAGGLRPRVLAHAIGTQPGTAKRWSEWRVPRPADGDQADALDDLLGVLARRRAELRTRLRALDDLAAAAWRGVAAGHVRVGRHNA